jgi:exodeoxyribonuclease VII small subunit
MSNIPKRKTSSGTPIEDTLEQLQATVEAIDNDELKLEDALTAFEKGITLVREAQAVLEQAEQRVALLIEQNGEPFEEALADNEEVPE